MKITPNTLYENKTWKYLVPCLKFYPQELRQKLDCFFKLGIGIKDYAVHFETPCLYILISSKMMGTTFLENIQYRSNFEEFLQWIKCQTYYIKDYIYDNTNENEQHMIVVKIPLIHYSTYNYFLNSEYSKMYSHQQIATYFADINIQNKNIEYKINKKISINRMVLQKHSDYLAEFVKSVNEKFNTFISVNDFTNAELDFPINLEEETFNYKQNEQQKKLE